jgi:hypothetical protein
MVYVHDFFPTYVFYMGLQEPCHAMGSPWPYQQSPNFFFSIGGLVRENCAVEFCMENAPKTFKIMCLLSSRDSHYTTSCIQNHKEIPLKVMCNKHRVFSND